MPTEADIRFMKRAIELGREVSLERALSFDTTAASRVRIQREPDAVV